MFGSLRITRNIIALVSAALIFIAQLHELPPKDTFLEPLSTQTFTLADALFRAQGVTTDGEYFYFSWNFGLIKTELDGETEVRRNLSAIPPALLAKGCKHIGGITYLDGMIYAPIEDSGVFEHLYIARYDAATLAYIDCFALPLEHHENGVPWCVADPDRDVIYSARRDNIERINVYDARTLELLRFIELDFNPAVPVHKVQGGEMYDGTLYLSVSRGTQSVFAVNPDTGETRVAFERNLFEGSEGEGMTVLPMADGSVFHILDIGAIRLSVHFRHYLQVDS